MTGGRAAMLGFGLPRAAGGRGPLGDARVWFGAFTVAVLWAATGIGHRWSPESRLRAAQVLLVLPTGALLLATGGDDLPVAIALRDFSRIYVRGRDEPSRSLVRAILTQYTVFHAPDA